MHESAAPHGAGEPPPEERQARRELAALYRLFAHFGWTDLTYTHLSARVAGLPPRYLVHPYGLLFEEVTASTLLSVELAGQVLPGRHDYNQAGHVIHSAVLRARPEIHYVLHGHTRATVAVSALSSGLLPLSQAALIVRSTLAYHDYGVTDETPEEGERLVADLGACHVMLLRNHGSLVCGRTPGEAFLYQHFLQAACEIQLDVLRSGAPFVTPSDEAAAKIAAWAAPRARPWGDTQWAALLRLLEREAPDYRD
jgi:ribulose-5-phosphate 4-epimerase/fuculose-1-phosphate aldolase